MSCIMHLTVWKCHINTDINNVFKGNNKYLCGWCKAMMWLTGLPSTLCCSQIPLLVLDSGLNTAPQEVVEPTGALKKISIWPYSREWRSSNLYATVNLFLLETLLYCFKWNTALPAWSLVKNLTEDKESRPRNAWRSSTNGSVVQLPLFNALTT